VKVFSSDWGVTVSVHLGLVVVKCQLPPAGISSVTATDPLAMLFACSSHGATEDAVVVSVAPLQPLKSRLVTRRRVCVAGTYPVIVELVQENVILTPRSIVTENLAVEELPLSVDVDVLPMGVTNGVTGLVPLDAVRFGVAKAGAATTTTAASSARLEIRTIRNML
jgi:hypothetical protein